MSDPKVPSWMKLDDFYTVPGARRWSYKSPRGFIVYDEGDDNAEVMGQFSAAALSETADLIDSCQEASGHE